MSDEKKADRPLLKFIDGRPDSELVQMLHDATRIRDDEMRNAVQKEIDRRKANKEWNYLA